MVVVDVVVVVGDDIPPPHLPLPPLSPVDVIVLVFASLTLLHCLFSLSAAATFSLSAATTPHFF